MIIEVKKQLQVFKIQQEHLWNVTEHLCIPFFLLKNC